MTEAEARAWLGDHGWLAGKTGARLERLVALVNAGSERQNLVSKASLQTIWSRHIVDSAQLVAVAKARGIDMSNWVDVGTGAGFPGMVVACLLDCPVTLIEPRPLRTAFLAQAAAELELSNVVIKTAAVERVSGLAASVISARAYAALDRIFSSAFHLCDADSVWLLPKGRQAEKELAACAKEWQGVFHVEQSVTDRDSGIIVARRVGRHNSSADASHPWDRVGGSRRG